MKCRLRFSACLAFPIVHGRGFSEFENDETHAVVIVSQATAQRLWPDANPLGKWIRFGNGASEVIGVAKDVYTTDLTKQNVPFLYRPRQRNQVNMSVLVRGMDVTALKRILRSEIRSLDPKLYFEINTLDEWRHYWSLPGRVLTILATVLGLVALLLACSGVYGVVNYDVTRRIQRNWRARDAGSQTGGRSSSARAAMPQARFDRVPVWTLRRRRSHKSDGCSPIRNQSARPPHFWRNGRSARICRCAGRLFTRQTRSSRRPNLGFAVRIA